MNTLYQRGLGRLFHQGNEVRERRPDDGHFLELIVVVILVLELVLILMGIMR